MSDSTIFKSEDEMQNWLSDQLKDEYCFDELIIDREDLNTIVPKDLAEKKIIESYKNCLKSLNVVSVFSENENISFNTSDILKPDFLLYAPETESMVIIELKNLVSPSRQVGTEISAYASEIKSYIPFISEGNIINVIISTVWSTLVRHYVFQEIFWLQRNIICLEPQNINGHIKLAIKDARSFIDDSVALKLSEEQLGGYQICLYDYGLYGNKNDRTRLDTNIEQMKTAISFMSIKGNSQKNHGFAFLWKDNWELSIAPYSITVLNFAPFQSLERLFHDENFEPNEITKRFIHIIKEYSPTGQGQSLDEIADTGIKFLEDFCEPRMESFTTWGSLKETMLNRCELISFHGWGIFAELFSDKLIEEYRKGNSTISSTDPNLGLELINELVDPNYDFYDLTYYDYDPTKEDYNENNDFESDNDF